MESETERPSKKDDLTTPLFPGAVFYLGGVTILIVLLLLVLSIVGYSIWPYAAGSNTTLEIFTLAQENLLATFVALDLGLWVTNLLYFIIYFCLFGALFKLDPVWTGFALGLGIISISGLIASRPVFEILTLSDLYFSAETEVQRGLFLAAGEALLLLFHGSAWHISLLFYSASQFISAVLMLKSPYFSKTLAYLGLIAFVFGGLFWIPKVGIVFLFISMVFHWFGWACFPEVFSG